MTGIVEDIGSTLHQAGIASVGDPGSSLRLGWDYWQPGQPMTDGHGIARTPHPAIGRDITMPRGVRPILDLGMSAAEIQAGIWRQCIIRPGDPFAKGDDPFTISTADAFCSRAEHLVALIGHAPRDLALWLDDLRRTDPDIFRLVLAKDFKAALAHRSRLRVARWPAAVTQQWRDGEGDYLPPIFVAILYAELARLAINQAGLLALSFDDGVELTTTQFLNRVPLAGGPHAPPAILRAIAMAPFQSVALTPPDTILENLDRSAAAAWSQTAAASIALAAGERGGIDLPAADPEESNRVRAAFAASPHAWRELREGHGASRQPRPAATRWGLNWRFHAATGLVELMTTAREWNIRYRKAGPRLDKMARERRAQALALIGFGWLAEVDAVAAHRELKRIEPSAAHLSIRKITPLAIDSRLGGRSGDDLLRDAEAGLADRPAPGAFGYTARYQAHLWIGVQGDDIAHYRRFQQDAMTQHALAITQELPVELQDMERVPKEVVALLGQGYGVTPHHGGIGHNQPPPPAMDVDPKAARAAQNIGMMVSPLSTNPILEMLMGRNRRNNAAPLP